MTPHGNLLGPEPTLLPEDPAGALLDGGVEPAEVAAAHPTSSIAWAVLAERPAGRHRHHRLRLRPHRLPPRAGPAAAQRVEGLRTGAVGARAQPGVPAFARGVAPRGRRDRGGQRGAPHGRLHRRCRPRRPGRTRPLTARPARPHPQDRRSGRIRTQPVSVGGVGWVGRTSSQSAVCRYHAHRVTARGCGTPSSTGVNASPPTCTARPTADPRPAGARGGTARVRPSGGSAACGSPAPQRRSAPPRRRRAPCRAARASRRSRPRPASAARRRARPARRPRRRGSAGRVRRPRPAPARPGSAAAPTPAPPSTARAADRRPPRPAARGAGAAGARRRGRRRCPQRPGDERRDRPTPGRARPVRAHDGRTTVGSAASARLPWCGLGSPQVSSTAPASNVFIKGSVTCLRSC